MMSRHWMRSVPGLALVVGMPVVAASAGPVQLLSMPGGPRPVLTGGDGDSTAVALSADGRWVVFVSTAQNLLSQPLYGRHANVFARNRQSGTTLLVSAALDSNGGGDGDSSLAWVSADGRFVVFGSQARNLVTNITAGAGDIFLRDLAAGTTRLVSVNLAGTAGGNGASRNALLTPDGRYVLFDSVATDLVTNSGAAVGNVYLRDVIAGTTESISVDPTGASGGTAAVLSDTLSRGVAMSTNGQWIAFLSAATNLVSPVQPATAFLVRDRQRAVTFAPFAGVTNAAGQPPEVLQPELSSDGRYLSFLCPPGWFTTNLTGIGLNSLYWTDLNAGATRVVAQAGTNSSDIEQFAMTSDGQAVAYSYLSQVFLWRAATRTTTLVSVNTNGVATAGVSGSAVISADGQTIAFVSTAQDLVTTSCPGTFQVFVRDLVAGATYLESGQPDGRGGTDADCLFPTLSDNGQVVVFEAFNASLFPGTSKRVTDLYAADRSQARLELVSTNGLSLPSASSLDGVGPAPLGLSADGRYVLFTSPSGDLVADDTNQAMDVFLYDRLAATNILISVNQAGTAPGNNASTFPVMTPDARFVAFVSRASDLIAPGLDLNGFEDIYVRDLAGGTTTLASSITYLVITNALASGGVSGAPVMSADGRYVAFASSARGIATNTFVPGGVNVYLHDLQGPDGTALLVATGNVGQVYFQPVAITSGPRLFAMNLAGNNSRQLLYLDATMRTGVVVTASVVGWPAVTPDGRYLAAWVKPAGLNLYDLTAQTTNSILAGPLPPSIGFSPQPLYQWSLSISDDGRYTAFVAGADGLTTDLKNPTNQVFVIDRLQPDRPVLVSANALGSGGGNRGSDSPHLSADGRWVVFRSTATDLVPGTRGTGANIFISDWRQGLTYLLSTSSTNQAGADGFSAEPTISADGSSVGFISEADNLVSGDLTSPFQLFGAAPPLPAAADTTLRVEAQVLPSAGAMLRWSPAGGQVYRVQFKDALEDPAWRTLPAVINTDDTGRLQTIDSGRGNLPQRYYRVLGEPQTAP